VTLRTTCPYCGVGCGIAVVDGVPRADGAHPANLGRLCSKGAALKDTLALPDRLTRPTIQGRETSWDEALGFIAREFLRVRKAHGPNAIAFYVSGQFLTEDYYVANKLMKGFIGAANIDTNSRLCMSSSVAGHVRAFGEDVVPGCYEDIEEADLVVLVGSNLAWCHPVLYQRLMAALEKRGTKIVNIDPRRTVSAEAADLHLPIAPGSDVALFNGLLVHLADTRAVNGEWITNHVAGYEDALSAARRSSPSIEDVARKTDVAVSEIARFYELFAHTERVVTLYSQGVNQSVSGTGKVNAIINCHLATGRIGRPGMGPFSLTGQPNAMGGREVGGLANQLAAHMTFSPGDVDRVRRFWNAPDIATEPGLKAVELFDAVADGRVKAVWIAATNPADSMPRAGHVREALAKCPLVIVSDAWPTDTTRLAHVVLPAASWAEKSGTVTNSERRISRQRAFRAPPGEARPDWWMFAQIGRRMGWTDAFAYESPAEIFREHAQLSAFENGGRRIFDIGGLADIEDDAYDGLEPVQWPYPKSGDRGGRLFARGGFPTDDGRARMVPLAVESRDQSKDYPFTLNTGRVRDQWHTMTRTGGVPHLLTHVSAPRLSLNPIDAARLKIRDDGLAQVQSTHGTSVVRVKIDASVRSGDTFLPMHWTDQFASSGPVGRLVHALTDPSSGQPDLKGTRIHLTSVEELWRGVLVRLSPGDPAMGDTVYWSRRPVTNGNSYELSGWSRLGTIIDCETKLRDVLQIPLHAELISYSDPKTETYRYAGILDGRLAAAVFFGSPFAEFPQAAYAARLLGQVFEPVPRLALLAGVDGDGSPKGKIVCSCFSVGEEAIAKAARSEGLRTPGEIGEALRAGTNCGSCIPEIKRLLLTEASRVPEIA
jgi:assimilatory nitrate reductase catalytic subunit